MASTNSRNQAVSSAAAAAAAASSGQSGSGLFGVPGARSVSSLVRLALSSNFPGGLLGTAQSYPTLGPGGGTSATASTGNSGSATGSARLPPVSSNAAHPMSESDQVSLEEFLESCRASSLLAELEDDDELPHVANGGGGGSSGGGGDDDDNDEDDDDEDEDEDDEFDENFDEEGFENSTSTGAGGLRAAARARNGSVASAAMAAAAHRPVHSSNSGSGWRRKAWDDDHVLRRKFSALIPAFDPRPGRTNVNQVGRPT